jgi:hypothetical protein
MSAAGTPVAASTASGEFSGSDTNSFHSSKDATSQRSAMKSCLCRFSVTITWASALTMATLVPGISFRW